ncbi:MAG: hypothetical protein U0269_37480 [Polyangiales bacterium]
MNRTDRRALVEAQRPRFAPLALALLSSIASSCGPDTRWKPAFDATAVGWLMNVSGPSPTQLYAVGGAIDRGVVMQFDGARWTQVSLGVEVPLLNWVHASSASDVTVVGMRGTAVRFDGTRWTRQSTPTTETLWGVWGASANDLWAVGGSGQFDGVPTIVHYDGSAWSAVALPTIRRADVHALFKVWGSSARDIYVVGQRGVVLHYDGAAWAELDVGASDDLVSLWGTSANNIVAVGGRGNGIISRWNGAQWRTQSLSPLPGLNGVWMRNATVAHAAGANGELVRIDLRDLRTTEFLGPGSMDFHSVFGDSSGRLTAVGGNLALGGINPTGIAYTRLLAADE